MPASESLYNLLFELSNEARHRILLMLQENAMRITEIAKKQDLAHPEMRRHLTRLRQIGLIRRDVEGYYHLTPYGETSILLLKELGFLAVNSKYFEDHSLSGIPIELLKRIGDLGDCTYLSNAMDFLRCTENLFKESREHVWILVDQFPMNSLPTILATINRGVRFRIIEPKERVLNPNFDAMTSEETQALSLTRRAPLVEQRMLEGISVLLYLSDSSFVLAFPTVDGQPDFKGFASTHDSALNWCRELYEFYWDCAEQRAAAIVAQVEHVRSPKSLGPSDRIVVLGQERPEIDVQAVQSAVDNYGEVVLKGTFNFGISSIRISRSVVIKGEGRVNDIPSTIIYKKGWSFPFHQFTGIFEVNRNNMDVSIENLHFTDFNCASIFPGGQVGTGRCNSVKFLNNRVTISEGYGRGISGAAFGDFLLGVLIEGIGDGGVHVEGNYIDLAHGGLWRGAVSRGGLEEDPEYRPDLFNHEYFVGFGIAVNGCSGRVEILNNVVRNASGRGIATSGHDKSIDVVIRGNLVESDVYGAYPMFSPESGAGIMVHTGLDRVRQQPGFSVNIEENTIKLERLNHSGIVVLGPSNEGSGKLSGAICHNDIQLGDGYEGIHLRKCDDFQVTDNRISGKAYYGIRLSGRKPSGKLDLSAVNNNIEDNDMDSLAIKKSDKYSINHADGRMFAYSSYGSATANLWFNSYTKNNSANLKQGESIIDEGENNSVKYG
jgi:predicted transcriptional regulator